MEAQESSWLLQGTSKFVLEPARWYYVTWDNTLADSWNWFRAVVCTPESAGCFAHVPTKQTVDFYMNDEACASDWILFLYLYTTAVVAFIGSWLYKMRERQIRHHQREVQNRELRMRRRRMARRWGEDRPHLD